MPVYRNTKSQTYSFGGLIRPDGSGVTLTPGEQVDLDTWPGDPGLELVPADEIQENVALARVLDPPPYESVEHKQAAATESAALDEVATTQTALTEAEAALTAARAVIFDHEAYVTQCQTAYDSAVDKKTAAAAAALQVTPAAPAPPAAPLPPPAAPQPVVIPEGAREPAAIEQLPEGQFATGEPIPGSAQNEDGSFTAAGHTGEMVGTEVPVGETGTVSNPPETPTQTAEELAAEVARLEAELAHQADTAHAAPADTPAPQSAPPAA